MKFRFHCEHDDNTEIIYECTKELLPDVVDEILNFLKGCGYGLSDLEIVNDSIDEK